jgi:uncharacterized protein involved in cysteine biosynthesis
LKALADLFDGKILKYTFLPLILSLLFWGIVFYLFSDNIYDMLQSYLSHIPFGETFKNILLMLGSGVIIFLAYYLLVISTLGVFSSFFIDHIVLRINEKHYKLTPKKPTVDDMIKGVIISIKSFLIYLVVFMFTFFFLFIPFVNIIYQLFMWSLLNKKPLVFDSSYLFTDPFEFEKKYNLKIWNLVFLTSIIYFIPFISLFGYTFQLVFMTHFVLSKLKEEK